MTTFIRRFGRLCVRVLPLVVLISGIGVHDSQAGRESKGEYQFHYFYSSPASGIAGRLKEGFKGTGDSTELREVFRQAVEKTGSQTNARYLDVRDPANRELVTKYDVSRAPMPMALVVAPNGAITGGFPGKFTEQQLLDSVVTPGMEKCLKAVQDKKLALVCIQGEKTRLNDEALKGVRDLAADPKYGNSMVIVKVDPGDAKEARFLKQFKVSPGIREANTILLAPPGVPVAVVQGATSKQMLADKISKSITGCGPGGCGPGGCGPAK